MIRYFNYNSMTLPAVSIVNNQEIWKKLENDIIENFNEKDYENLPSDVALFAFNARMEPRI